MKGLIILTIAVVAVHSAPFSFLQNLPFNPKDDNGRGNGVNNEGSEFFSNTFYNKLTNL